MTQQVLVLISFLILSGAIVLVFQMVFLSTKKASDIAPARVNRYRGLWFFQAHAGRIDPSAPNLSRPCFIQTANTQHIANTEEDFAELLKKAVPVTEFLKGKEIH